MCMASTAIQEDSPVRTSTQVSLSSETTINGLQIIHIHSQTTSQNSKVATLLPGEVVSTMTARRNTNQHLPTCTIRTTLGRGLRFKACIWHGVEQTGATVSKNDKSSLYVCQALTSNSCCPRCLHFLRLLRSFERNEANMGQVVPNKAYWPIHKSLDRSSEDLHGWKWHWICC